MGKRIRIRNCQKKEEKNSKLKFQATSRGDHTLFIIVYLYILFSASPIMHQLNQNILGDLVSEIKNSFVDRYMSLNFFVNIF